MKQTKECPSCHLMSGWWSSTIKPSMVIYSPTGEKLEHRIYEQKRKHCMNCDTDITKCVEED